MSTPYDRNIKPHLQSAHEFAHRCAREISRLPARPDFFTLAIDQLDQAERLLEDALQTVRDARREYDSKSVENERAA
jgi:hypothetical protein